MNYSNVAISAQKLNLFMVRFCHFLDITDGNPVYHSTRCISTKYNEAVKTKIESMLQAGIIELASLAWSFSVVPTAK